MTLTVGSLFSGIGGLELGLEAAGMHTMWQVENNPYCQKVLDKHWPDVVRYADVKDVGAHNLAPVDVICGGFPCQDISYAGKGAGLDGHRSGLWHEFARIIREMGPRYAVVENVPALLTRGIDQVLGTLADLGYDAEWTRISAADVGAPHLRHRIFIVAYANSERGRPLLRARDEEPSPQTPGSSKALGDPTRGRREQPDPGLGRDGESGEGHLPLVDAESGGRGEGRREPARRPDGGREELGNPDQGPAGRERRTLRGTEAPPQPEGREQYRGSPDGPTDAGREMGDWSDATAVRGTDGTIRLVPKEAAETGPQSPLWPVADGIPGRVARLSAIGNAVVPRVALAIGNWINQHEEQANG